MSNYSVHGRTQCVEKQWALRLINFSKFSKPCSAWRTASCSVQKKKGKEWTEDYGFVELHVLCVQTQRKQRPLVCQSSETYCLCRNTGYKGRSSVSQAKRTVCTETQNTKTAILSVKRNVLYVQKHRKQRPQVCQSSEMHYLCRTIENKDHRSVSQAKRTVCAET